MLQPEVEQRSVDRNLINSMSLCTRTLQGELPSRPSAAYSPHHTSQLAVHGCSQTPQAGQVHSHRQLLCSASWNPLPVHSEQTQSTQERDQGHSRQARAAPARASTKAGTGKYSSSPHTTAVATRRSCTGRPRTCCPRSSWQPGCEAAAAGRRRQWRRRTRPRVVGTVFEKV